MPQTFMHCPRPPKYKNMAKKFHTGGNVYLFIFVKDIVISVCIEGAEGTARFIFILCSGQNFFIR